MTGTRETLSGWGNCSHQVCCSRFAESLPDVVNALRNCGERTIIARGLGRSYGDSAINEHGDVLHLLRLNRFLSFDSQTGLLECEAGVSFADIIECFLPSGWFLPTTPGTKFVTVGGAIAADVHGKNHHIDGSFGNFVESITLQLADGSIVQCTPHSDPELFWATVGGMGLTGIILSGKFRLTSVQTAYCNVLYRRTNNLDATLDYFQATHDQYRYSVAWVDCVATGHSLGRSVLMLGNDADRSQLAKHSIDSPLELPKRSQQTIPCKFPNGTLNYWTVKAFNTLFYAKNKDGQKLVDFNTFYYPLDCINRWNRIYGRKGFVQYQALFPIATARVGLQRILERITRSRQASFLAVLKGCGAASPGMLSYLFPGFTLALDFPYRGSATEKLFESLDQIVLEHGGRLYLAKDALMSADSFARMYPRLPEFLAVKSRVDPHNRFMSSQARRLGIVPSVSNLTFAYPELSANRIAMSSETT